jgi:hypothetical protein
MNKKQEKIITDLKAKFPNVWFNEGSDFGGFGWSGEGSEIDGLPAFDYDSWENTFVMGVQRSLHDWAASHGMYWECYDPGTYCLAES